MDNDVLETVMPLMQDMLRRNHWLHNKIDVARRRMEHEAYFGRYLPEANDRPGELFVDIGPGLGESLQIAQSHGMDAVGIDSPPDSAGGMGNDYVGYCALCHVLHGLNVVYNGFDHMSAVLSKRQASIINSRGSIEQVLAPHLEGEPHSVHHDCRRLRWNPIFRDGIRYFLTECRSVMADNGILMIAANGTADGDELYSYTLMTLSSECGFSHVVRYDNRTHKLFC